MNEPKAYKANDRLVTLKIPAGLHGELKKTAKKQFRTVGALAAFVLWDYLQRQKAAAVAAAHS